MDQKDEVPHGVTMGWIRKREVDQPEELHHGENGVDQERKALDQGEEGGSGRKKAGSR